MAATSKFVSRDFFSIDNELLYFPFCADFGPLNYGNSGRQTMIYLHLSAFRVYTKIYSGPQKETRFLSKGALVDMLV